MWKKNIKVNKKCKEIYRHERAFSKDPSFSKQNGGKGEICNIYEKIWLSKARWQPGVWEKKRVKKKIWQQMTGTRKYQTQGGNVLQQTHSPDNKIQQRTNLFQNIQSSLNLKQKFTRNCSNIPVKGRTSNRETHLQMWKLENSFW